MSDDKKLKVYIASAGAGKTHTLTGEYLRLALQQTYKYRGIQAVTFTNKATAEMKERIVHELSILAHRPAESSFAPMLGQELGLEPEDLQRRSRLVLRAMLLDYQDFRVSTIDAFFQEILRAFARELGFSSSYRINLEAEQALSDAVTDLLVEQDLGEGAVEVGQWLKRVAGELAEEGRGSDLRRKIMSLGRELYKERVQTLSSEGQLPSREQLTNFDYKLKALRQIIYEYFDALSDRVYALVEEAGLSPEHFYYKDKGIFPPFKKWRQERELTAPNSYYLKVLEEVDKLPSAEAKKQGLAPSVMALYHQGLRDCLHEYKEAFQSKGALLRSINIARRHLSSYGLISDIDAKIKELHRNERAILLADTSAFINQILKESDAPFIYEKLGAKLEHLMIDEFQDTSSLQYENFRPLLENGLASGQESLVVGDVKQSIYRWRNSDSSLLAYRIGEDFPESFSRTTLIENWRSTPEIVAFNNALYPLLAARLSEIFSAVASGAAQTMEAITPESEATRERLGRLGRIFVDHYADVTQEIPPSRSTRAGNVSVHSYSYGADEPLVSGLEGEPVAYPQELVQLVRTIRELRCKGYRGADMAILVRGHKEAAQIASVLSASDIEFVSEEALLLEQALSVRLVLAGMQYIADSGSELHKRILLELYAQLSSRVDHAPTLDEAMLHEVLYIGRQGIYEVVNGLYELFAPVLPAAELSYQIKMLDMAYTMQRDRGADVVDFLSMWAEEGYKAKIVSPANDEAVQLMTIHKSKGLGFEVVLLPYLDWSLVPAYPPMLWTESKASPFNDLDMIPVSYSTDLLGSYFTESYLQEAVEQALDSLNLLYVATTRAKRELHIWMPNPNEDNDALLSVYQAKLHGYEEKGLESKKGVGTGRIIQPYIQQALDQISGLYTLCSQETGDDLSHRAAMDMTWEGRVGEHIIRMDRLSAHSVRGRISILREGLDYFREDSPRRYGRVMHSVLAEIETAEDIESSLRDALYRGWISERILSELHDDLQTLVALPESKHWFASGIEVMRELPIIGGGVDGSRRPDRVVIMPDGSVEVVDYKFGGARRSHIRQVREYMSLLERMGYAEVRGYLWYVTERRIVSVSADLSSREKK